MLLREAPITAIERGARSGWRSQVVIARSGTITETVLWHPRDVKHKGRLRCLTTRRQSNKCA
jgi:hypothetical protein